MYPEGSFLSLFNKSQLNPVHAPSLYYVRNKLIYQLPTYDWALKSANKETETADTTDYATLL
jgi:hypothetical protein